METLTDSKQTKTFEQLVFCSAEQRSSYEQLLPNPKQIRRLLLASILCYPDMQHEKCRWAKYHLRQLRSQVLPFPNFLDKKGTLIQIQFSFFQRPSVRRHRDGSMSDRRQTRNWYQGRSRRKMRSAWQKTKWVFRRMLKLSPIIQFIFCRRWNRTEVTLVQQWGSHCQACGRNGTDVSSFRRGNETKSYQLSCN